MAALDEIISLLTVVLKVALDEKNSTSHLSLVPAEPAPLHRVDENREPLIDRVRDVLRGLETATGESNQEGDDLDD